MKIRKKIQLSLAFACLLAVLTSIEFAYAAYVTHSMIHALDLKGEDALNFRVNFNHELSLSISSLIVVACQLGVWSWSRQGRFPDERTDVEVKRE
jgi:hypothetical protein